MSLTGSLPYKAEIGTKIHYTFIKKCIISKKKIPPLKYTSCMTLGKALIFSEPILHT